MILQKKEKTMAREKQTRQVNRPGKPSGQKKALTLPTTDKPSPFLDRLDPAPAKPPPDEPAKQPEK